MPHGRTTFSKFIIEDQRSRTAPDPALTALLNDIQTACKFIASAVSKGKLYTPSLTSDGAVDGEPPVRPSIADIANEIMLRESDWGGQLCGVSSTRSTELSPIPADLSAR